MLRIFTSTSAAAATKYFDAELSRGDYYAEKGEVRSAWNGKGAAILGLEGQDVTREAFAALAANYDPETGEQLTPRMKEDRRAGYDFTFSAPKSVSVFREFLLATGREEQAEKLTDAFGNAAKATMAELEADMRVRLRAGGQQGDRVTGNMVWAGFTHFQSRPVEGWADPHLHMHAFAMNLTHDGERWKAGEFGNIKTDATYYQEAFHARLAANLREQGYGIAGNSRDFELAGIGRDTVEKFSRRTAEVEAEAQARDIQSAELKSRLGARTRNQKEEGLPPEETRARSMARLSNAETAALEKLARGDGGDSPSGLEAREAVEFAIAHTFERVSVIDEKRLAAVALQAGAGLATPEAVREALQRREGLLRGGRGERKHLTTRQALAEEEGMERIAREGRGSCHALAAVAQYREEQREGVEAPIDLNGSRYRHRFTREWLSGEQKLAVTGYLHSRDRVAVIRGGAGTGKTAMLQELSEAIEGISGKAPVVIAPSAEASRGVLRDEGFAQADTLSRFLSDRKMQEEARGGTIVLDEAGLVGVPTMHRLLSRAKELQARVILQGDTRQHSAVERGDALRLLEQSGAVKVSELVQVRRQQDAAYREAVKSLAAGKVQEGMERLEGMGAIREIEDAGERYRQLADSYVAALGRGERVLAVSPTHGEGAAATAAIRARLKTAGSLGEGRELEQLRALRYTEAEKGRADSFSAGQVVAFYQNAQGFRNGERVEVVKAEGGAVTVRNARGEEKALPLQHPSRFAVFERQRVELAVGDLVRITENGRDVEGKNINNGSVYRVAGLDAVEIQLEGEGKTQPRTVPADFGHIAHGYVSTSHAAQGRTVDRVLIAQSSGSARAASAEQFYVSASRARRWIEVFTDSRAELLEGASRSGARMSAKEVADSAEPQQRDAPRDRPKHPAAVVLHFRQKLLDAAERFRAGREPQPEPPAPTAGEPGYWQRRIASERGGRER